MTSPAYMSVLERKFIDSINERYQAAFDLMCYWLINKSRWYEEDVTSKIHKMRKKIAVQMKDLSFNGKDPIWVINFLAEF